MGETTKDGMFTLKAVECLASCGTAPMMQIGETYHENITLESCDKILMNYKEKNELVTHFRKERIMNQGEIKK